MSQPLTLERTPIELPIAPAAGDQATAAHAANSYLRQTFGASYSAASPVRTSANWQFLIQCQAAEVPKPIVAGRIEVDAKTGRVIPLSPDEIQETQERVAVRIAKEQGTLAVDQRGYILPYLAKIKVNGYLTDQVTMFAGADGHPQWIASEPPCWRVTAVLRLRAQGPVGELGTLDVNALTGEVIPLTNAQLAAMQRRAEDAAASATRPAATPG